MVEQTLTWTEVVTEMVRTARRVSNARIDRREQTTRRLRRLAAGTTRTDRDGEPPT